MNTADFRNQRQIQINNDKVFRAYLAVFTVALTNSVAEIVHKSSHKEKIRRSKNSTVSDRESNSLSDTVEFFLIAVFLGVTFVNKIQVPTSTVQFLWRGYRILPFWGLADVRFLFYLIFILKYLKKKTYFRTPPARSETGFENLTEFRSRIDL